MNVPVVAMVMAVDALHLICNGIPSYGTAPATLVIAVINVPAKTENGIVTVRAVLPSSVYAQVTVKL